MNELQSRSNTLGHVLEKKKRKFFLKPKKVHREKVHLRWDQLANEPKELNADRGSRKNKISEEFFPLVRVDVVVAVPRVITNERRCVERRTRCWCCCVSFRR